MSIRRECIVVRQLVSSDFGLFAELRDRNIVVSKQRAINFNKDVVVRILVPAAVKNTEQVVFDAHCVLPGVENREPRVLKLVGKNWRLGGRKIPGVIFLRLREGDLFVCRLSLKAGKPLMTWTVLMQGLDKASYQACFASIAPALKAGDGMAVFDIDESAALSLTAHLRVLNDPEETPVCEQPSLTVRQRLKQPHILQEAMKVALTFSSEVQKDFLEVLENTAEAIRDMLGEAGLIRTLPVNHASLWKEVRGRPMGFIDGGVANLASMGTEPIAVRVGSYVVIPGAPHGEREWFTVEKQLVDELFDPQQRGGIFDEGFDDVGKLRDVARISLEAAGALETLDRKPRPEFLLLHGALVNPVSSYALKGFPNFTERAFKLLLPGEGDPRTGRDCNFISTYLRQLIRLRDAGTNICGVVERSSSSAIVLGELFDLLKRLPTTPGASTLKQARERVAQYRISDAVLFHCILNTGEYIVPIAVDRNELRRAPDEWKDVIRDYPRPYVAYVGVGEASLPLRVEFFGEPPDGYDRVISVVMHSCRLMPKYSFPAGLDIVDKFAKVPNWMCRPVNGVLAVQFMKNALETKNPRVIEEAKRMLCGNTRDWLFRPTFEK